MSNIFTIESILAPLTLEELNTGYYLHLYKVDCAPPHIAFSIDGTLYELNHNGPRIRNDIEALINLLKIKKIKALFFKILPLKNYSIEESKQMLASFTNKHVTILETKDVSCLSPIKDFFKWGYEIDTIEVGFIFDLLPLLNNAGLIINTTHLNMEGLIDEKRKLSLKKYTREDIDNRIRELNSNK